MSVDDRGDELAELRELKRRVDRLESGTMLENSSITRGRMRFIGGLLRVDSGGRVEIVGTLAVEGTSQFVGPVTISGNLSITGNTTITGEFNLDGPWTISGDGDITGDVEVTGNFDVLGGGRIKVGNVVLTPGNGGRITIGTGSSQIIIDPSQLKVGPAFKMDPAHSSTGAQMEFGTSGTSTIYGDNSGVQIQRGTNNDAAVRVGTSGMPLGALGVSLVGDVHMPSIESKPPNVTARYLGIGDDGLLYKLSSGGGGGGNPGEPPSGNPDGYIWPADPAVYGISDNFAAHVARGSAEPGVDVMTPVGAPLWSPAAGTIVAVQASPAGATGRFVTLVTTEGDWFRFLHNSAVVVSAGQTVEQAELLAYTGGSGFGQEAHYGPHTHISFARNYSGAFPGSGALSDFQAYMASQ